MNAIETYNHNNGKCGAMVMNDRNQQITQENLQFSPLWKLIDSNTIKQQYKYRGLLPPKHVLFSTELLHFPDGFADLDQHPAR